MGIDCNRALKLAREILILIFSTFTYGHILRVVFYLNSQFVCSDISTAVSSRTCTTFLNWFALLFEQPKLCLCFRVLWFWPSLKISSVPGIWIWWFIISTANEGSYNHREMNTRTVPDPSAVIGKRINPLSKK